VTVRVRIAALLHSYTRGADLVEVEAATAREVMAALDRSFPGLAFRVVDEQGRIRPHMSVFVGEERIRELDAPLPAGMEVYLVGALSGG
jgi:sulfur-carrier protein